VERSNDGEWNAWGKDVFIETECGINTAINKLRGVPRDDPFCRPAILNITAL
jgi:hypothetical protein